ncbi:MAG: hypothetical protein V2A72_00360 [Candidatus Omnitrophota bacterium]
MHKDPKNRNHKLTARYYIETIILKLDRIEAELEMVKVATIDNSRQARLLDEKIKLVHEEKNN